MGMTEMPARTEMNRKTAAPVFFITRYAGVRRGERDRTRRREHAQHPGPLVDRDLRMCHDAKIPALLTTAIEGVTECANGSIDDRRGRCRDVDLSRGGDFARPPRLGDHSSTTSSADIRVGAVSEHRPPRSLKTTAPPLRASPARRAVRGSATGAGLRQPLAG